MKKDTDDDYDDEPDLDVGDDLYQDKEKESDENDDDYVFDEVKGAHGKKSVLSKLNQRKVGKHEMDEIFCDWN